MLEGWDAGMRRRVWVVSAVVVLVLASLYIFFNGFTGAVRIRAATTTSLYATGLLDYLARVFSGKHRGFEVGFMAVGSGEALRLAADGSVCLVLVHAPSLEKKYIEQGVLVEGRIFAYNYFVVAGPSRDPAGVRTAANVSEAFSRIYSAGEKGAAVFVSRGDSSGTHVREMMLWRKTGLDPRGRPWYMETGSGMAETLLVADEKEGYVLSDIGTFLKLKSEGRLPGLEILYMNDTELINIYSAYIVSGCGGEERRGAEMFIEYLVGEAQELIASYGVDEYGQSLFYPAANKTDELREAWMMLASTW